MKKYNFIIFALSLLGIIIGYSLVAYPETLGVCKVGDISCLDNSFLIFGLGRPLAITSFFVFLVSIILSFARNEVFRSWLNFAKWFLPLSIIGIIIAPTQTHNLFLVDPFDKQFASLFLSAIFFLVSLLIIAIKSWRLRKSAKA